MYGVYFDYYGYERKLMAICKTIIECKKLIWEESQDYVKDFEEYKKMFTEYGYSIQKLEMNTWTYSL